MRPAGIQIALVWESALSLAIAVDWESALLPSMDPSDKSDTTAVPPKAWPKVCLINSRLKESSSSSTGARLRFFSIRDGDLEEEEEDEMDQQQYKAFIHETDDGESFDIDTPIAEIEAFQSMQQPSSGNASKTTSTPLPNNAFFGLSQDG